jgi:hypothetical protein
MTTTRLVFAAALLAFPRLAAHGQVPARAPATATPRWSQAHVTYVTSRTVYVDAGTDAGITEGMRLDIIRAGLVVATLKATYLSTQRTSCEITSSTVAIVVGDTVRFLPAQAPAAASASDSSTGHVSSELPRESPAMLLKTLGFRGRVGLRQLMIAQRDSGSASLSQPAADVRLDASSIAGSVIGLTLDVRGRHTTASGIGGLTTPTTTATVYQAALTLNSRGERLRATLGRQYADALASVSLFDGLTASWEQPRWSVGAMAGVQPEPVQLGLSSALREYGAFATVRAAPGSTTVWSLTSGAVGSYQGSEINREFLVEQATIRTRRASLYVVQEIDANRGWKRAAGQSALSPTSTFALLRVDAAQDLSLIAGVDGRRNVLLIRDRGTPESAFDDAMRRGAWGGLDASVSSHVRLGADARLSDDGSGRTARSWTGSLNVFGLTTLGVGGRLRSTIYSTDVSTGMMHVAALSVGSIGPARVELNGGLRSERFPSAPGDTSSVARNNVRWFGADADIGIAGSWYLLISTTRQRGGWEGSDQVYTSLTYRF